MHTRALPLLLSAATLLAPVFSVRAADPNTGVEAAVRAAFADAPVMISVAKCESGFRQFAPDGSVLRGGAGRGYLGIFQIGESLHTSAAAALGFDILTVEGNIGYAKHLYGQRGSRPWLECVPAGEGVAAPAAPAPTPTASAPAPAPVASVVLTANLQLGMTHAQVRTLQQRLNAIGYVVATDGVGSKGRETSYFGGLTREALRRFQCEKKIVCEGNESTTGYGRLGPRTRAALLSTEY